MTYGLFNIADSILNLSELPSGKVFWPNLVIIGLNVWHPPCWTNTFWALSSVARVSLTHVTCSVSGFMRNVYKAGDLVLMAYCTEVPTAVGSRKLSLLLCLIGFIVNWTANGHLSWLFNGSNITDTLYVKEAGLEFNTFSGLLLKVAYSSRKYFLTS